MKKLSFSAFLFLLLSISAYAQPTMVIISGTVLDTSLQVPPPGYSVKVVLDSTIYPYSNTVYTDVNGYYADTTFLPQNITQITGVVSVLDCNFSQVTQNISLGPNFVLNNLDFTICTGSTVGSCQAQFASSVTPFTTQVAFTDLSQASSPIASWQWDFGDGGSSTLQNPTRTYAQTGSYNVCLTTVSAQGCISSFCDSVTISGNFCAANLTAFVVTDTAAFNANPSGSATPLYYTWDPGDASGQITTSSPSLVHIYPFPGTYNACVDVTFIDSCVATSCTNVVIGSSQAFCNASFTSSGQGTSVSFQSNSTGSGNILSYDWDFGDGNSTTTSAPNASHSYASTGTYYVCLDISTSDSCTSTYCDSVVVSTPPACLASYYHYPDSIGPYTIIIVNTSLGNGLSYSWDFGDGNSSTQAFPVHQYAGAGTYQVCLTVTSSSPACTSVFCDSLVVTQKMAAAFSIAVVSPATGTPIEPDAKFSLEIWPNPASDNISVRLYLPENREVGLEIVDLQGKTVMAIPSKEYISGQHTMELRLDGLSSGMYMARLRLGSDVLVRKLVLE